MSSRSRVRWIGVLASVAALTVAGCSSDGGQAESTVPDLAEATGAPETSSIKVGVLPTPDYVAAQVALDHGFFDEEGLEVTTEIMSSANSAPSIVGGSYDIGGINWISYLLASSKDVPIVPVAQGSLGSEGYASFLVTADSEVEELADLDGERVGVLASPGNCDLIPTKLLRDEGSDAEPEWVSLAVPDMPANLQRGNVAASCVPEPLVSALLASGDFKAIHDLFVGDVGDRFPVSGFAAAREFVDDNPNAVGAFQRAIQKALDLIHEDESVLVPALLAYTTLTEEQTTTMNLPAYPDKGAEFDDLQKAADLLVELELVDEAALPTLP